MFIAGYILRSSEAQRWISLFGKSNVCVNQSPDIILDQRERKQRDFRGFDKDGTF